MGKKRNIVSLAPKMNFFQRLIWKFRYNHTPQVMIVHKTGFTWQVFTRVNSKGTWMFRETLKNKKAAQAMQFVKAKYRGYVFYMPERAFAKAAAALNKKKNEQY